jgi:hypothetical protein
MSSTTAPLHACLYDNNTEVPLLEERPVEKDADSKTCFDWSQYGGGMAIGVVIQVCTLIGNDFLLLHWGAASPRQVALLCLLSSFASATIAMAAVEAGRYCCGAMSNRNDQSSLERECRFVEGAFIGVCLAWAITDVIAGMSFQIVYSIFSLAFSVAWCRFMKQLFAVPADEATVDSDDVEVFV